MKIIKKKIIKNKNVFWRIVKQKKKKNYKKLKKKINNNLIL